MLKRIPALCLTFLIAALPLIHQSTVIVGAISPAGRWELIDTVDYVTESQTFPDGAALSYSMSGNSVTHTTRNNAGQEFSGTCSWADPPAFAVPGEQITISLNASIVKLDPKRVGTFSATVSAYLDTADTQYKFKSGSAVDLKSASGDTICKALGKDGQIVTGSAGMSVFAPMPDGSDKKQIALMLSTNIGGGKKYVYEYTSAGSAVTPDPQPPEIEEPELQPQPAEEPVQTKELVLTGTVKSVDSKPMRNMSMRFTPSFQAGTESKTDSEGRFRFKTDIPSGTASPFTVDVTLRLRYMRPDSDGMSDVYFAIRDEAQKPNEEVTVTTKITVDLNSAQWRDKDVIGINRDASFAHFSMGLTESGGRYDPVTSNLGNLAPISGYTYIYDQLSSAVYTAIEAFHEKDATISAFPLTVFVNKPGEPAGYFTEEGSLPTIHVSSHYSAYNDTTRFTILHEFGHYFDYATNSLVTRCGWDTKIADIDYINHGGYLNADTGDSFIEGFATWYAVMVQRHGLYPIPNYANIADLGSLSTKRKPWNSDISEELCISSILTYLERDMTLDPLWSVLKNDRDNFNVYYHDLLLTDFAKNNLSKFNRYFKVFGIYKQAYGNRQHDDWEFYRVVTDNGFRDEYEPFADIMFDRFGVLSSRINPQDVLKTLGQSSDFMHNRDALPVSAGTILRLPNSYLKVTGLLLPGDVRVAVIPDGEPGYAYVGTPEGDLVYLPLPEEPMTGMVEVTIPGGDVLYRGELSELQAAFLETRGESSWLAEAELTQRMLPEVAIITCPVDGDVWADPVIYSYDEAPGDVQAFSVTGELTGTGRPSPLFDDREFVLNEISESLDDEFVGGYALLTEGSAKKKGLPVLLFALAAVIVLILTLIFFLVRKKRHGS